MNRYIVRWLKLNDGATMYSVFGRIDEAISFVEAYRASIADYSIYKLLD